MFSYSQTEYLFDFMFSENRDYLQHQTSVNHIDDTITSNYSRLNNNDSIYQNIDRVPVPNLTTHTAFLQYHLELVISSAVSILTYSVQRNNQSQERSCNSYKVHKIENTRESEIETEFRGLVIGESII